MNFKRQVVSGPLKCGLIKSPLAGMSYVVIRWIKLPSLEISEFQIPDPGATLAADGDSLSLHLA